MVMKKKYILKINILFNQIYVSVIFFLLSVQLVHLILASCRVGLIRSIAIDGVMCYSLSTFSLISGLSCNIYGTISLKLTVLCIYRENKRERGNFLFVREDFVSAINSYNK